MRRPIPPLVALAVGALLGFGGAHVQWLGSWTLLPWGAAAFLVGVADPRTRAPLAGALFGFALSFTFMIAAYTGTAPLLGRLPFFALLGMFGAGCGAALSWLGARLGRRFTTRGGV